MSKSERFTTWILAALTLVAELIFGIWMAHWNHFIPNDSLSRVANAYYVLFSRDRSLSAIGFIWNPLPSLLIMPILLFKPLLPELAYEGIASVILTAIFASATVFILIRNFIRWTHSLVISTVIILLFIFNPFIFLYGSNGMSEMIFIYFIVACVIGLIQSMDDQGTISMVMIGFCLALGFLTRYESVAFGFFLALSFAINILASRRTSQGFKLSYKETYQKLEASELILLTPAIYTGLIWIFLNFTIMGNPLYFLNSSYSNLAQSEGLKNSATVSGIIGHLPAVLLFVLERSACFLVPLVAIIMIRIIRRDLFKTDFLVLLLLILSIPLMQIYMLYKGASFGWLRFFVYPLPIIFAWLPYELKRLKNSGKYIRFVGYFAIILCLIASSISTFIVMHNGRMAPDEYQAIHYKDSEAVQLSRISLKIARDIDRRVQKNRSAKFLMDSFSSNRVILTTRYPQNIVITSDRDFKNSLKDPVKYNINYLLVPSTGQASKYGLDAINQQYPHLYQSGAKFAKLDKDYGDGWRLYKIISTNKKSNK
ncbi:hypothetical protein [Sporolactobacillus pectinivorans]|uniref:hypothetical protein n=1 Tax=Sporolactobacillus pectinivorans TaxID=1591408 RepID=UPI000C2653CB|nr:hypothetical protein [Sporolactobacillus pectinivorans]